MKSKISDDVFLCQFENNERVKYMNSGVDNYISKAEDINRLIYIIEKNIDETEKNESLNMENTGFKLLYDELVGISKPMLKVRDDIIKAANLDVNIMILGETGTGKELVAKIIHNLSKRKNEPFIPINVAAMEKGTFLSEIFGHEKGSFTNAIEKKKGLFEIAAKGTIFLDEIGDLDNNVQVKLLRILEEKKLRRLGGTKEIAVNASFIAVTNRDLMKLIKQNQFRKDLFFRLNAFTIKLPSLREIQEDIITISEYYLEKFSNRKILLADNAKILMMKYHWPGNVRELQNVIKLVVTESKTNLIKSEDIKKHLISEMDLDIDNDGNNLSINSSANINIMGNSEIDEYWQDDYLNYSLKEARNKFTKKYLEKLTVKYKNNVTKISRHCKVQRSYIYKLFKDLNIKNI